MNLEEINSKLESNLCNIDKLNTIGDKMNCIENSHHIIKEGEELLEKYENIFNTYEVQPKTEEVDPSKSIEFIEKNLEGLENLTLDKCMEIYGQVMDEISTVELFVSQKKKDYEIIE